ncbi:hypothetical protein K8R47_02470 [archaeon]|nr:hypothetical protein [archaeon]
MKIGTGLKGLVILLDILLALNFSNNFPKTSEVVKINNPKRPQINNVYFLPKESGIKIEYDDGTHEMYLDKNDNSRFDLGDFGGLYGG